MAKLKPKQKPKNKYERTFLLMMIEGSTGNIIKDIKSKKVKVKQVGFRTDIRRLMASEQKIRNQYAKDLFNALLKDYEPEKKEKVQA